MEKSAFFNYRQEDAERYPAEVFAEYFASFIGNGIFNGGDNLRAYCSGTDRLVRVLPGAAWINGYYYRLDQELELALGEADATHDRLDRIVLRLNLDPSAYSITLNVLAGTPAAEPVAPDLVRDGDIYDLGIATVLTEANTISVSASGVTDTRLDESVCGLVNSLISVDSSHMQSAFDTAFSAWTSKADGYSAQWSAYMVDCRNEWAALLAQCDDEWAAKLATVQDTLDSKADAGHKHAAGDITAGTLAGRVQANATAVGTLANAQVRNIIIATSAPSSANNGDVWLSYT